MHSTPIISAGDLLACDPPASLLDVRWDLATGAQRDEYERGHIPGAAFVDLDTDLAAPPGAGGRHPMPATAQFGAAMRRAGVSRDRPVVVYDARTSMMAAARAWWLLRYFGHPDVAVLDGGLAAWVAAGGPLTSAAESPPPGDFTPAPGSMPLLDAAGARALTLTGLLIDARAPERFRGESEPLDPVAGHIPGAVNRSTSDNLDPDGRFLSADALRDAFDARGASDDVSVGVYCGSGVTAAHEVLALELAGFHAALYVGSWSDWITDPQRPVARGESG